MIDRTSRLPHSSDELALFLGELPGPRLPVDPNAPPACDAEGCQAEGLACYLDHRLGEPWACYCPDHAEMYGFCDNCGLSVDEGAECDCLPLPSVSVPCWFAEADDKLLDDELGGEA